MAEAIISTEDLLAPMDDICSSDAGEGAESSDRIVASVRSLKLKGLNETKKFSDDGMNELEMVCSKFCIQTGLQSKMMSLLPKILDKLNHRDHRSAARAVFLLKANFYQSSEITIEKLVDHLALVSGVKEEEEIEKKKESLVLGIKNVIPTVLPFLTTVELDVSKESFGSLLPSSSLNILPEDEVLTQEEEERLQSSELDENDLSNREFESFLLRGDAKQFVIQHVIPLMVKSEKEEEEREIKKKQGDVNAENQDERLEGENSDVDWNSDEEELW